MMDRHGGGRTFSLQSSGNALIILVIGLYVACEIIANVTASKPVTLGSIPLIYSVRLRQTSARPQVSG